MLIADAWQPSLHDSDGPTLRDEAERIRDSLMMLKSELGDRLRVKVVCNCNTICVSDSSILLLWLIYSHNFSGQRYPC